MNLCSSILPLSDTYPWFMLIPTVAFNVTQFDNIGLWWDRYTIHDRIPGLFSRPNEQFNTLHSLERSIDNRQTCISIENRPCYCKYNNYPNRYDCCCSSSITINNCPSSL